MKQQYHLHGGPEEIKGVIKGLEKTNPSLAEILKKHINPKTGVPFATDAEEKNPAPVIPPLQEQSSGVQKSMRLIS